MAQNAPVISLEPTNQTVLAGGDVSFSVALASPGPFSYQWQCNGASIPGLITTVAGNGSGGYSGDGGAATDARLSSLDGVAVDGAGNLFIADTQNNVVRKVDATGVITTFAGNGTPSSFSGDGDGGAATNASLWGPTGVALDGLGNLFVADSYNSVIRVVVNYAYGPSLSISNATAANAGNYDVVITSPFGSVTSMVATLTVLLPPSIGQQPKD